MLNENLSLCLHKHIDGNKTKGRISKRVFQESKARQIFRKTNISRKVHFRKIWIGLLSWNTRFEIRPFALLLSIYDVSIAVFDHLFRSLDHITSHSKCCVPYESKWIICSVSTNKRMYLPIKFYLLKAISTYHTTLHSTALTLFLNMCLHSPLYQAGEIEEWGWEIHFFDWLSVPLIYVLP